MIPAAWTPYCGPGATPADAWSRWNLDPVLLAVLAAALVLCWIAFRRAGTDAGGRERVALLAGFAVLAVIFVSPLCALSSALFAARTTHHLLLVAVAAPLLALGLPRLGIGVARAMLWLAVLLHIVVFWAWHAPSAYGWALSSDLAYWLMQLGLLGTALAFWSALRRANDPAAVAALLIVMVQMGLLGAIVTFAERPLYAPHLMTTGAWGLTPLEDQQAAGLLMWVPAAALYLAAALARLARIVARARDDADDARTSA